MNMEGRMRRLALWGGLALLTGQVFTHGTSAQQSNDLHAVAERQMRELLASDPEYLSSLGIHAELELDDPDSRLTARGPGRKADDVARIARWRDEIEAFDAATLSGQPALTREILSWHYRALLARAELPYLLGVYNRSIYAVDQMDGIHVVLPQFMISNHPLANEQDAEAYIARLKGFGAAFDQTMDEMQAQSDAGVVPPSFVLDKALRDMRDFVQVEAARNALVVNFAQRLETAGIGTQSRRKALKGEAEAAVRTVVYPAYRRLIAKAEAVRAVATDDAGVWKLPQGDKLYRASLRMQTTTDMSPDEIHALGLKEVARILSAMDGILRAQGYRKGTVGERMAALAKEKRFVFPDTEDGRAKLVAYLQSLLDGMDRRLPDMFGALPKQKVTLKRVPVFAQSTNTMAFYSGPSLDGSRPGVYYINLRDPTILPRFNAPSLTYHEAIPGHHLQIALASEITGLPLIRRETSFNAFVEGWALYAEELASEMGMYADDPFGDLGRLQYELWRAVRLVVDTGLHVKKWSREKAIDYMRTTTGMSPHDVEVEIDRYIVWPGQACGYKLGQLTIKRLREEAKARLGEKFDLKGFHDVVLTSGAMPLAVLEKRVRAWNGKAS